MLVGDAIIGCRTVIPDLPRQLVAPLGLSFAANLQVVGSCTLLAGSYYVKVAAANQWGEVPISGEIAIGGIDATHGIRVTAPNLSAVPGATKLRVYIGIVSGGQNMVTEFTAAAGPYDVTAPGTPGFFPVRSTAYYPDADGSRFSANTVYGWLNAALEEAAKVCGGIPDFTGVPTINGQGLYTLTGLWSKITYAWWDGYPLTLAGQGDLFYRNFIPGVTSKCVLQMVTERIIAELQPQPNRSGGATTLAAQLGLTDTQATLTAVTTFKMPFGLALIGNEIVYYNSIVGNVLTGLIRGIGGTVQAIAANGSQVSELNFRFSGLRQWTGPQYLPGDSAKTLPVPSGWRKMLQAYMLSEAANAVKDYRESQRQLDIFVKLTQLTARGNKPIAGPRQVGGSSNTMDVYFQRLGGGVIVS